jgi:hypothetical protein
MPNRASPREQGRPAPVRPAPRAAPRAAPGAASGPTPHAPPRCALARARGTVARRRQPAPGGASRCRTAPPRVHAAAAPACGPRRSQPTVPPFAPAYGPRLSLVPWYPAYTRLPSAPMTVAWCPGASLYKLPSTPMPVACCPGTQPTSRASAGHAPQRRGAASQLRKGSRRSTAGRGRAAALPRCVPRCGGCPQRRPAVAARGAQLQVPPAGRPARGRSAMVIPGRGGVLAP